ncbi:UvrD-helicase domain-containing protein [Geomonas sp. RF6]|uniref:UvrD-helicase domain-containing protein n=1 Tax=Geomonas sp. RF6 TaxID=2897342 RepID=UPI001E38979E|nr:UvrD-helicase domain-containing protein [Geomonas sp. RF6]UFS72478.1 UvrD-helicase domain-containing protein [Geomonas sp. RF6]
MTTRITNPDTEADLQLRECLDQQQPTNFVMVAGAGSGKTTSLVKALAHLAMTRGPELRRRGQQIACITYTEVAVGEIQGDVGNAALFHVSTIHSFLWTIVQPFQNDLREWVLSRLGEKIAEAERKLANPRTRAHTREQLTLDVVRYRAQCTQVVGIKRFIYGTGSDYSRGVLGHDDILKVGPSLITDRPLLRTLIASRFPYIFVDESQDTNPTFVDALRLIADMGLEGFCLGFFGDPMQKIYTGGAGPITPGEGWVQITKPENFRCPLSVLRVINRVRAEDDGLQQVRGRTIVCDGVVEPVEGSARLFIVQADARRAERLTEVRRWLSRANDDVLWENDEEDGDVRVLVLVHRVAAHRLGFADIYAALNDNGQTSLKAGLVDGTAWIIRPFMTYLLPLVVAAQSGADFEVIAALRSKCPLLTQERLAGQNSPAVLARLQLDVDRLVAMFADEGTSIRAVLELVRDREILGLDERLLAYLERPLDEVDEDDPEDAAVRAFLASPAPQLWGYRAYVENQSPFATQQGIKGAEFQRVLVLLDDEESHYTLFSYGKYFGIEPLSDKDQENIQDGVDSVVDRTRRLFYVCCSRAVQDLAVVLFVPDVRAATEALIARGYFERDDVHTLGD